MVRKAISWDRTEIAFEVEGAGPPLVLLHGFAANRHCWREKGYVDRLASAGRQVILIDARGHGMSGKPPHPAYYADQKRAQDTIAVLEELSLPSADLHGFSMGGRNALVTARTFPGRVRSLSINGAHGFAQSLQLYRDALEHGMEGWIAYLRREYGSVDLPQFRGEFRAWHQRVWSDGILSSFSVASFGLAWIIFSSRPACSDGCREKRRSRMAGMLTVRLGSMFPGRP